MLNTSLKRLPSFLLAALLIASCEHSDYEVTKFTGDYRYYAGIAEFFDCDSRIKYYLADAGISEELQQLHASLDINEKDDVYLELKGYLKEEQLMDGINPTDVFVPVELLKHDTSRGCERGFRQGG